MGKSSDPVQISTTKASAQCPTIFKPTKNFANLSRHPGSAPKNRLQTNPKNLPRANQPRLSQITSPCTRNESLTSLRRKGRSWHLVQSRRSRGPARRKGIWQLPRGPSRPKLPSHSRLSAVNKGLKCGIRW